MFGEIWIREGERFALLLTPSTVEPGGFRITSWDATGPVGHTEHRDLDAARETLRARTGPWAGDPDFGIPARPAAYHQAEVEPSWLGLTVITEGRIEQEARDRPGISPAIGSSTLPA